MLYDYAQQLCRQRHGTHSSTHINGHKLCVSCGHYYRKWNQWTSCSLMEQPDSLQKQPNTQTGYTFCSCIIENKRSKLREKLHSILMVMDFFVLLPAFLFKYSNCVVEQHHKMCCILWKHRGDYDHCQLRRSVGDVMIIFLKHGNRKLTTDEWLPSNIKTSSAKQSKSNTIITIILIALFLVPAYLPMLSPILPF